MKTFKDLIAEVWEHPFSGKDYFDDSEKGLHSIYGQDKEFYSPETRKRASDLQDHYKSVTNGDHHYKHTVSLDEYIGGSKSINSIAIAMHKHAHDFDPGYAHHTIWTPRHDDDARASAKAEWDLMADDVKEGHRRAGQDYVEHVHTMDDAMQQVKTPHDMHVYSGVSFHPIMMHHQRTGKHFGLHLPAFTSTSLRPSIAASFAKSGKAGVFDTRTISPKSAKDDWNTTDHYTTVGHVLKIHIPKGSAGVYVGHTDDWRSSMRFKESEFILPRHSKLIIGGKSAQLHKMTYPDSDRVEKSLHIWHAKLVHDGFNDTRHMEEFK
jgi:hypothetical protein